MIEVQQNIQDYAKDRKVDLRDEYLKTPNYIFEHYDTEREDIEEYDGRQFLEILQNADDASVNVPISKVYIELKDQRLIIANTGHYFTQDGLESILFRKISPKFKERQVIGNKGLGFRSILSWVDKVSIFSGDLQVAFSEKHSHKFLDELIEKKPLIKKLIEHKYKGFENAIATLRVPEIILKKPNYLPRDYHTYIVLDLKKGIEKSVINQIQDSVDLKSLIFINNLEEIHIEIDGFAQILKADRSDKSKIKLSQTINNSTFTESWYIHSIEGEIAKQVKDKTENHFYKLSVAWQDDWQDNNEYLYSYFKTKVSFPFPGLLHGTFELSSDRNQLLNKSEFNNELVKKIPQLLCEVSSKIAEQNAEIVNYKALSFLNINFNALDALFKEHSFHSTLIESLKNNYIFPSIANSYISFKESPVFYENKNFSEILNPERFSNLLKHIEKTDFDLTFGYKIRFSSYNKNSLLESISEDINHYELENYARLIIALTSLYGFKIDETDSALFYDSQRKLLSFGSKIFIPDNNDFVSSTRGLKAQIIDPSLYESLKAISENEHGDFQELLEMYNLSSFKIDEVIELLIDNYINQTTKEAIVDLNTRLFKLYKKYKNTLTTTWDGKRIPLLSIKKSAVNATELYFTKNYDENLVHQLYSYNSNKLVANYSNFNIDKDEQVQWKNYLKWTGVADMPRKFYSEILDDSYANYCLQKHNYCIKIGEKSFKNYEDFNKSFNSYGATTVYSVDDLSALLDNNLTETILTWLYLDSDLNNLIDKDIEPDKSRVPIHLAYFRSSQNLGIRYLKNYVKWKISNSSWLSTENDTKRKPIECTTSVTITEDFNGILDKPRINYENALFTKTKLKRTQIQYLLQIIGVHESIASLSTHDLYNILLKLPEIDQEGKKVKTIYREIANNYDEKTIDEEDINCLRYKYEGKIYGQAPDMEEEYLPLQETYYVDNKRYGNSIISLFNRVAVDRRKNKTRIQKIFNIAPLENLKISIKNEPIFHSLNNHFEKEIQQFKPYVYVFRQDYDKKGSDRNRIKNTKFRLVNSFIVNVNSKDEKKEATLEDYDYYYDSSKREILIVCPNHIRSIEESKIDVQFCSAIAEAFSSLLDIEQQRNQIRELYSKNLTGRNQLLSEELDDTNTERLQKAKEALNIISNQKLEFWIAFFQCFPSKRTKNLNTDEQLVIELARLFNQEDYILIKSMVNKINYEDLNSRTSLSLIVSLLLNFKISLDKLNAFIYPTINLKPLYTNYFIDYKEKTKQEFKGLLYEKGISERDIRAKFLNLLEDYDQFIIAEEYGELDYKTKVQEDFYKYCKEVFSIELNYNNPNDTVDIEVIRKSNKSKLLEKTGFNNQQYAHYFENKREIESLIYFEDELDGLVIGFEDFIENLKVKTNSGSTQFSNNIKLKDKELYFDTYEDLLEGLTNSWSDDSLKRCDFQSISTSKKTQKDKGPKGAPKRKGMRKNYRNQNHIGFIAEFIVWNFIRFNLAKKNTTEWASEYARDAGVNPEGKDGLGYDIKYVPKNAETYRYVEVKAIGWDKSFKISSNEIKVAEKLKNKHKIFLVSNVDDIDNAKIEEISGLFAYSKGEGFYDNEKFSVLNDNFIIKYDVLENE